MAKTKSKTKRKVEGDFEGPEGRTRREEPEKVSWLAKGLPRVVVGNRA